VRPSTKVAVALSCLALTQLPGCGGSSGNPTGGGSRSRSVISQEEWQLGALELFQADLSLTGGSGGAAATVDATVDWTFPSNNVNVYVTSTSCTIQAFFSCTYVAKADTPTAKPERVAFTVTAAGNYRFWVVNFGPAAESGTLEIAITQ
jgi:hypothetical protein